MKKKAASTKLYQPKPMSELSLQAISIFQRPKRFTELAVAQNQDRKTRFWAKPDHQ